MQEAELIKHFEDLSLVEENALSEAVPETQEEADKWKPDGVCKLGSCQTI